MVDLTLDPKFWICLAFPGSQRKLGLGSSLGEQEILQVFFHLKKVGPNKHDLPWKSNKPVVGLQQMLQLDIWYLILPNSWVYTWNLPDMFRMSGPFCICFWWIKKHIILHTISGKIQVYIPALKDIPLFGWIFGWILNGDNFGGPKSGQILGEARAQALRLGSPLKTPIPGPSGESDWRFPNSHPWLVVSNIFYFHSYFGKIPILTNIFLRGWNHQLDP